MNTLMMECAVVKPGMNMTSMEVSQLFASEPVSYPFILVSFMKMPDQKHFREAAKNLYNLTIEDKPLVTRRVQTRENDPRDRNVRRFSNFEDAQRLKKFEGPCVVILEDDFVDLATFEQLSKLEEKAFDYAG